MTEDLSTHMAVCPLCDETIGATIADLMGIDEKDEAAVEVIFQCPDGCVKVETIAPTPAAAIQIWNRIAAIIHKHGPDCDDRTAPLFAVYKDKLLSITVGPGARSIAKATRQLSVSPRDKYKGVKPGKLLHEELFEIAASLTPTETFQVWRKQYHFPEALTNEAHQEIEYVLDRVQWLLDGDPQGRLAPAHVREWLEEQE
jgi:hypothetical protein